MRLFIFARHAESAANAAGTLNSDPRHPVGLTTLGEHQARLLGHQLAYLEIDRAICTRLRRTQQTIEIALHGRGTPLVAEPELDEVRVGAFDGARITSYWSWKARHRHDERFPGGESLVEAALRYAAAFQRLLDEDAPVTLVVCHELALRYLIDAAAGNPTLDPSETRVATAVPYLFDEAALGDAVGRLQRYASAARGRSGITNLAA